MSFIKADRQKIPLKKFHGQGYSRILKLFYQDFSESKIKLKTPIRNVKSHPVNNRIIKLELNRDLIEQIKPKIIKDNEIISKRSALIEFRSKKGSINVKHQLPSLNSWTNASVKNSSQVLHSRPGISCFPNRRSSLIHNKFSNHQRQTLIKDKNSRSFMFLPHKRNGDINQTEMSGTNLDKSQEKLMKSSSNSSMSSDFQNLSYNYIYD